MEGLAETNEPLQRFCFDPKHHEAMLKELEHASAVSMAQNPKLLFPTPELFQSSLLVLRCCSPNTDFSNPLSAQHSQNAMYEGLVVRKMAATPRLPCLLAVNQLARPLQRSKWSSASDTALWNRTVHGSDARHSARQLLCLVVVELRPEVVANLQKQLSSHNSASYNLEILPHEFVVRVAAAVSIQASWRAHRDRRGSVQLLGRHRAVLILQCGWRRCIARQRRQLLTLLQSTMVQLWSGELMIDSAAVDSTGFVAYSRVFPESWAGVSFDGDLLAPHRLHPHVLGILKRSGVVPVLSHEVPQIEPPTSTVMFQGASKAAVPVEQFHLDLMFGTDLPLPWPMQSPPPFPAEWLPPRWLGPILATQHSARVFEYSTIGDAKLRAAVLVLRSWRPWSCKRGTAREHHTVLSRRSCFEITAAVTLQRVFRGLWARKKLQGISVELWASRPVQQCLIAPTVGKFWVNQGGSDLNIHEVQNEVMDPQQAMSAGSHRAIVQLEDHRRTAEHVRCEAEANHDSIENRKVADQLTKRQQVACIRQARVKARAKSATTRYPRANPQQLRDALDNPFGTKDIAGRRSVYSRTISNKNLVRGRSRPSTARAVVAKVSKLYTEVQRSRGAQKLEATRRRAKKLEQHECEVKANNVQAVRDRRLALSAQRAVHAAQAKFPTRLFSALERRYAEVPAYVTIEGDIPRAGSANAVLSDGARVFCRVDLARGVPPSLQSG